MANDPLDLDSEEARSSGFPWIAMIAAVILFALAAGWIVYSKTHMSESEALETELRNDKIVLKEERDKVFEITQELEALKQAIASRQIPDPKQATAEYNRLAAQQRAQREKVQSLADQYNAKVAKLQQLD